MSSLPIPYDSWLFWYKRPQPLTTEIQFLFFGGRFVEHSQLEPTSFNRLHGASLRLAIRRKHVEKSNHEPFKPPQEMFTPSKPRSKPSLCNGRWGNLAAKQWLQITQKAGCSRVLNVVKPWFCTFCLLFYHLERFEKPVFPAWLCRLRISEIEITSGPLRRLSCHDDC